MANQSIALQARAPQSDPLGGAIRNNAQMINMMMQQQAAQRQNAIAEQTMQIQRAKEARETAMAAPQLEKAQSEAGAARLELVTKAVGHALHTSVNNPTDETLDQAAATLAGIGLNPAEIEREIMPIKQLPLDQRKGALMQSILSDPNSKAAFEATLPKPKELRLGDRIVLVDENPLSPTFNQPIRSEMVGVSPNTAFKQTGGGGIPAGRGGDFGSFKSAVVETESHGDYTALSPKGALGAYQVMPATAKTLAGRLGLPWNPELMRSNTPEGRQYQDAIGNAAAQEAWQAGGGDPARAAAYYHGGSDSSKWGSKTRAYARSVVANMGNGGAAPAAGGGQLRGPVKGEKPATEPTEVIKAKAAAVQDLYDAVEEAHKKGHLVAEDQSYLSNRTQELLTGRTYLPGGTAKKTSLDNINATAKQLLRMFIQKGTSGTLNTKAEQDAFLQSIGGGDSTYETRMRTIRNFARQNGIQLNDYAARKPRSAVAAPAKPAANIGAPPQGVSADEWKHMTPEERKLWAK